MAVAGRTLPVSTSGAASLTGTVVSSAAIISPLPREINGNAVNAAEMVKRVERVPRGSETPSHGAANTTPSSQRHRWWCRLMATA